MAGILDLDPQTQGLLQAAFAGLQASGPSRMPVSTGQVLGQAGTAGLSAYDQAQKQQAALALQALQIKKAALDAQMQQQIMQGGEGGILGASTDPDKLEAIGTKLALLGHPGGAGIINAAENMRKKRFAQQEFQAQKSPAVEPVASANAGETIPSTQGMAFTNPNMATVPPEERGLFDAALNAARTKNAAARGEGGLFAPLMASPYVGEQAKGLQAQLNASQYADPEQWLRHYERLFSAHQLAQQKEQAAQDRIGNLPKSEHVIQDKDSPTGWSYEDTRSGAKTQGAPPPVTGAAVGDVIPPEHKDLHGEDYLATLPTGMASLVKSIASGAVDSSKAASLRYGNREAIMQRVLQYDPTYKAARANVYQQFMNPNGKIAQNLIAGNTVVAHLGTLNDMTDALQNKDLKAYNAVANRFAVELGRPEVNNFDIAKQAVGNELMRVFRQVQASEAETKDWEAKFSSASSPAQLKGAIKTGVTLLKGRLDAINDQWKSSMETDKDFPVLSEKSKQVLARIGITGAGIPLSAPGEAPSAMPTQRRRYNPATGRIE